MIRTFTAHDARRCLFAARVDDDKYRRGVVELVTGSLSYPGAARLGAEAAAHAGAGMVRYLGPDAVGASILAARPEIVLGEGRADAVVAGSGIADLATDDRASAVRAAIAAGTPVVLDAGALSLIGGANAAGAVDGDPGEAPDGASDFSRVIATPHAGEFARVARRVLGLGDDLDDGELADEVRADPANWGMRLARRIGSTILLKGATTTVVSEDGATRIRVISPTSVLATAGTGDVLAGTLGAFIAIAAKRNSADRPSLAELGATAAWVNGRAALLASARALDPSVPASIVAVENPSVSTPAPVTALEVAAAIPAVVGAVLEGHAE